MADDPSTQTYDQQIRALAAAAAASYVAMWNALARDEQALLDAWFTLAPPARAQRLRLLQMQANAIAAAGPQLASDAAGRILASYRLGAATQATLLGDSVAASTPTLIDLQALVTDATGSLLDATTHVAESTKAFVRQMTADHINAGLRAGQNPDAAATALQNSLATKISAVTYRDGSQFGLDTYAEMVTRTVTAVAYQRGSLGYAQQVGIQYVEIMDGPNCGWEEHDDPDLADGSIRTIDDAMAWPVSHPNCVRVSSARPDITTQDQADNAEPSTTAGQRADQAVVSAQRYAAAALAARQYRTNLGGFSDSGLRVRGAAASGAARRSQVAQRRGFG